VEILYRLAFRFPVAADSALIPAWFKKSVGFNHSNNRLDAGVQINIDYITIFLLARPLRIRFQQCSAVHISSNRMVQFDGSCAGGEEKPAMRRRVSCDDFRKRPFQSNRLHKSAGVDAAACSEVRFQITSQSIAVFLTKRGRLFVEHGLTEQGVR
jgi:hypothetical protein